MTTVVCYMGGTAGDLITALIDSRNAVLNGHVITHAQDRSAFKKPHKFANDLEKIRYLDSIDYKSVPSHDLDFHYQCQHDIILITVETMETAIWAANRFHALHRLQVWKEMTSRCGADTMASYAQALLDFSSVNQQKITRTISLENILNGSAIDHLQKWLTIENLTASQTLYQQWLAAQE